MTKCQRLAWDLIVYRIDKLDKQMIMSMRKTKRLTMIVCYNGIEFWESRERALAFYKEGARYCEGCEAERYMNVVMDLIEGYDICTDGESDYKRCMEEERYKVFTNGTNIRDLDGREWNHFLDERGRMVEEYRGNIAEDRFMKGVC